MRFAHQTLGQRVLFGVGNTIDDLVAETERLQQQTGSEPRIMLIASDSATKTADAAQERLPVVHRHHGARRHVPVQDAESARHQAHQVDADLLVAIGGGSAIGLAKAVALTQSKPIIAVPTTYAGSEATNVWGLTEGGRKTTGVNDAVLPASVIYDAEAVAGLPAQLAAASGLNALAHSVDAMWAPRTNPINQAWAVESIRALGVGLPLIAESNSVQGRQQTQYGAYLAAVAFASAGSALHHKICHVLGGAFDLPHADTHAVILPYVLAFNAPEAAEEAARISQALGTGAALEGLEQLKEALGAPTALRDCGLAEADLEQAAQLIFEVVPESNPRPMNLAQAQRLISAAWAGEPASQSLR